MLLCASAECQATFSAAQIRIYFLNYFFPPKKTPSSIFISREKKKWESQKRASGAFVPRGQQNQSFHLELFFQHREQKLFSAGPGFGSPCGRSAGSSQDARPGGAGAPGYRPAQGWVRRRGLTQQQPWVLRTTRWVAVGWALRVNSPCTLLPVSSARRRSG